MPRGSEAGKEFEVNKLFTSLLLRLEHRPNLTGLPGACERQKAREYDISNHEPTDAQPGRTEVWVESKPNTPFHIVIKDYCHAKRKGKREVMATVYVDGKTEDRVADRLMFLSDSKQFVVKTINIEKGGRPYTYPLMFSEPDTVDDLSKAQVVGDRVNAIGTIVVELDYGSSTGDRGRAYPAPVMKDVGLLYEKHAKVGTIVKSAGKPKPPKSKAAKTAQKHEDASIFTPCEDGPFYTFKIKYAIQAFLVRNGHMEDPNPIPKPPPTPKSNPPPSVPPTDSRKRARPSSSSQPCARSLSSSSSSSSSSSDSEAPPPIGQDSMFQMFQMFMATQEAEKKAAAEAKKARKEKKRAKKDKRKAEKAKRPRKRSGAYIETVDLTLSSDEEDAAGPSTQIANGSRSVAVKQERR